jgi:hypothetical protein
MRRFSTLTLAVALAAVAALAAPARAWQDPAAAPGTPAVASPSTSPALTYAAPQPATAPLDHKHSNRIKKGLAKCEKCEAAKKAGKLYTVTPPSSPATTAVVSGPPANPMGLPPGAQIVACAHSKNGVCASCRKWLTAPGEMVMVQSDAAPSLAKAAPGRAAVGPTPVAGYAVAEAPEPEPIGVMKTTYNQVGPNGAPAGRASTGRASAGAPAPVAPGSTPYISKADEHDPHVLSHLFGFSAWKRDVSDWWNSSKEKRRSAHAATTYGPGGEMPVDVPASAVYGKTGSPR